jgi:xanthine dehydrogenase accessory factor
MSIDLAREEAAFVGSRQPYARVTVVWAASPVSAHPGDAALVTPQGELIGWVGGSCSEPVIVRQAVASLADGRPRLVHLDPSGAPVSPREGVVVAPVTCASGGALEVFVEPRLPAPHLVVVGRSPMARTLAAMAQLVDFEVTVVEREDADVHAYPGAAVVTELDLAKADVAADSFVVVATMGRYDEDALEAALATDAQYVALVASARRSAAVREELAGSGVPDQALARIRAPAGLDLGALPHPEIAVAILADIVAEKAARGVVSSDAGPAVEPEQAVDPVCGMTVDPASAAGSAQHDGVTYWFCASGCRRRFEADPAAVLAGGHGL